MSDRELFLIRQVAIAAMEDHRGCTAETCGGTRYDPCPLGGAIDDLMAHRTRIMREELAQAVEQAEIWVLRTWVDVRRGDVVRMPGQEATAAEVMELIDLPWHVNDRPPAQAEGEPDDRYAARVERFMKDVQYRPNGHAGEWTARPVTLHPLAGEESARHRIPNVNPAAPVEIRTTRVELDAIELLGGWAARVSAA